MYDKIGIVTVLYNSEKVLKEYLQSLNNQVFKNFELYIVDNNSKDNGLGLIEQLRSSMFFKIFIIRNSENYGVARGNNQGIQKAITNNCSYILLSNNDVVLNSNTINILYNSIKQNNYDMVVPKIYFYNSKIINQAGGTFDLFRGCTKNIGYGKKDSKEYSFVKELEYSSTCFMLMKSSIFQYVGFFDEKYFVYYDDTDFVWRAKKLHCKLFYIPDAEIEHKESFCTGGAKSMFSIYYIHRNLIYFINKNYPVINKFISLTYQIIKCFIKYFFNSEKRKIVLKAFVDGNKLVDEYKNQKRDEKNAYSL